VPIWRVPLWSVLTKSPKGRWFVLSWAP